MFNFTSLSQRNRKLNPLNSCRPRLEWMEPRTLLSAVTWTGDAGDNNWDSANNWSPVGVPGSGADVTINISANVVHSDIVADLDQQFYFDGNCLIDLGRLGLQSPRPRRSAAAVTLSGGTLTGTGDVTVSGLATLSSGTISGSGRGQRQRRHPVQRVQRDLHAGRKPHAHQPSRSNGNLDRVLQQHDRTFRTGAVFDNLGVFQDQCTAGHEVVQRCASAAARRSTMTEVSSSPAQQQPMDLPARGVPRSTQIRRISRRTDRNTLSYSEAVPLTPGARFTSETGATLDFSGIAHTGCREQCWRKRRHRRLHGPWHHRHGEGDL